VVVQHDNLANGARVLELQHRLLLDTEDNDILATDSDSARATADSLERVLDLNDISE